MIKKVTVINSLNEALVLEMRRPDLSGLEVRNISGLGPVKGTIGQAKVSTRDGVKNTSATLDGRNIVLSLGLLNHPTVEQARLLTYRYFAVKSDVTLIVETDQRTVRTRGRVESNEPSIFGTDTGSQISILCEDAYLEDATAAGTVLTSFYATTKGFTFPFNNPSLTQRLIEFGKIEGILERNIDYVGDGEVGISITINATGPVGDLTIYNPVTNEAMVLSAATIAAMTGEALDTGDRVTITTSVGNKTATLLRDGVRTNIRNALGRRPAWLTLRKGRNTLAYTASSGEANVQLQVESKIYYEGV